MKNHLIFISFNSEKFAINNVKHTEKTVLSNQQKYFIGIYATKLFSCANKTFCYINQILVT